MKFDIDQNEIQSKAASKTKLIVADDNGNLYELIPYTKPKDED